MNFHLYLMAFKLQKLHKFGTKAATFLPLYDVKKSEKNMSSLNTQFQEVQEKVKTKKKFGFKESNQKTASAPVMALGVKSHDWSGGSDISSLSMVDAGSRILLLPDSH
jgi:hypothetical protein